MLKRLWCFLWGHDFDLEDRIYGYEKQEDKRPQWGKAFCKRCNRYRKLS